MEMPVVGVTEWKREKLLGSGGQAQVFLASTITQPYSSYVLPPLIAVKSVDTTNCRPLIRENQILEDLGCCQSIIKHHGSSLTLENGRMIYNILLEFAEGGSLTDRIQTHGANGLPENQVRDFTESILLGLKHMHDRGYIHRDIKPDNILICNNGVAKIADFGLSKKLKPLKKNKLVFKGTTLYMAPETVVYGEYRSSCDVWSLGCVVLEMLTGSQPWDLPTHSDEFDTLYSYYIASDSVYPSVPRWVSPEARDFMMRCFSKDPRYRWTVDMLLRHPFIVQSYVTESIDGLPRPNFLKCHYNSRRSNIHHHANQRVAEPIEGIARVCGKRMWRAIDDEVEILDSDSMDAQDYISLSVDDIPFGF